MKSKVFFVRVSDGEPKESIKEKLRLLIEKSGIFRVIKKGDAVALKMHFGEEGNAGFVNPGFVRAAVDKIKAAGADVVLIDTNTLYRGRRMKSDEHKQLAYEHGFTPEIAGAEVRIANDRADNIRPDGKFVKIAKVSTTFSEFDSIVGIAHFKGHIMTEFGGALKNLGMGCATREGKLAQHSDISPRIIIETCTGCAACVEACPVKAIKLISKKAKIDAKICIGCASCIAACKFNSIDVDWEAGGDKIQQKMVEYTKAVMKGKKNKCAFINFATKITAECDCLAKDDPKISPDVGLFASVDPVALDKASFDMVLKKAGKDVLKEAHPKRDGLKQLKHAQELGIGNIDYDLIDLS